MDTVVKKTTHQALVSRVEKIYPHPNADALDIIEIDYYTCSVRRGDFNLGDLFVFVVPDTIVDATRPEFAFLTDNTKKKVRIKVKKLRGLISQGLIIHAPEGFKEGDDVWDYYGFERFDPEFQSDSDGNQAGGPSISKYDVDAINKYVHLFNDEDVVFTEKIHGENFRAFYDGELHVGSRTTWKKDGQNKWWGLFRKEPGIEVFLVDNPGLILYGEAYGPQAQDIHYGLSQNAFAAFDIRKTDGTYLKYDDFVRICDEYFIPRVPEIYRGKFDLELLKSLAEEKSALYNGGREGIVVRTVDEAYKGKLGRCTAKFISNWYFTRKK